MNALPSRTSARPVRWRLLAVGAFVTLWIAACIAAYISGETWVIVAMVPLAFFSRFFTESPGPLFFYDVVRLARRGRGTLLRCGYALALLVVLCAAWKAHFPEVALLELGSLEGQWVSVRELPRFAQTITLALLLAQGGAVLVLTPAYLARAVTEEKERGTLDLLFTSHLSDREIILGKLLARLLHLGGLFMAAVPVLCLTLLWGGVSAPLLMAGCVVTAATLLSVGGVSVLCSVLCGKARAALAWSYALVAAFCLVGLASPVPYLSSPVAFVLHLDQELAGRARVGGTNMEMMTSATLANLYAVMHILLASACVGLAVRWLRRAARGPGPLDFPPVDPVAASRVVEVPVRRPIGAEPAGPTHHLPASRPPPVGERPLLWKEMYQGGPIAVGASPRRLLKELAGPWLLGLFLAGLGTLVARATVLGRARGLIDVLNLQCSAVGVILAGSWCVGVAFRAAAAVSSERERGTLDGLLALPVERGAILRAKWLGSILRFRTLGYALAGLWSFGLALGALHPLAVLLSALTCAAGLALLASLGLWLSLVARTTLRANVGMAVVLLVWFFGPWLAAPFIGLPVPCRGCWPRYFDWCGCNPLGAWWVAHFSWADLTGATGHGAALLRARLVAVLTGCVIQTLVAGLLWLLSRRRFRSTFGR